MKHDAGTVEKMSDTVTCADNTAATLHNEWAWTGADIDHLLDHGATVDQARSIYTTHTTLASYLAQRSSSTTDTNLTARTGRHGISAATITTQDDTYPAWLRERRNAPQILSIYGQLPNAPGICVAGGEHLGPYSAAIINTVTAAAAATGAAVWCPTGTATGRATLQAALDAHCLTVATVSGDISEHLAGPDSGLYRDIVEHGGCVVSLDLAGPPQRRTLTEHARLIAETCSVIVIGEDNLRGPTVPYIQAALDAQRMLLCAAPKPHARRHPGVAVALAAADEQGGDPRTLGLIGPGARPEILRAPLAHGVAHTREELAELLTLMWQFAKDNRGTPQRQP